jgi:hypothetical protein
MNGGESEQNWSIGPDLSGAPIMFIGFKVSGGVALEF